MSTPNALDDRFDDAERGLEWLEKLEALQARSASDQAAYEVAEYVMKLRTAVTELLETEPLLSSAGPWDRRPRSWWRSFGSQGITTIGIRGSVPPF